MVCSEGTVVRHTAKKQNKSHMVLEWRDANNNNLSVVFFGFVKLPQLDREGMELGAF